MLKLVINSPKGGVGKTTLATNAVLFLASQGKKVLAWDLAGGLRMSQYLRDKQAEDPTKYGTIEIREDELGELPTTGHIKGARGYDVMIADTDDYYKILNNLLDKKRKGWRAIAPIVPDDSVGLERISQELKNLANQQTIVGLNLLLKIVPNRCGRENEVEDDLDKIRGYLDEQGISGMMSNHYIYNATSSRPPIFLEEDNLFYDQLKNVLYEIGIV